MNEKDENPTLRESATESSKSKTMESAGIFKEDANLRSSEPGTNS